MTTKVIQADREAAEPFRRGKGGKYDRDQEALAYAFASHADPLRRALEEVSRLRPAGDVATCKNPRDLIRRIENIALAALSSGENNNGV